MQSSPIHDGLLCTFPVHNLRLMAIIITLKSSVTRFGEMTPLWQIFKALGQNFDGLVSVEQNFEPHLANLLYYVANSHCSKWTINKQIIYPSGHTARNGSSGLCTVKIDELFKLHLLS